MAGGQLAGGHHILVVEDDPFVQKTLRSYLESEGFRVTTVSDGKGMRASFDKDPADLVIMDLRLPGEDGFHLTRELRDQSSVGIIILTAKQEVVDRVVGLEIGADDYVTKPWDERELLARIRSVLRRVEENRAVRAIADKQGQTRITFDGWTLDLDQRNLNDANGDAVALTTSEYALLVTFVEHATRPLSRDFLLDAVYKRPWEPFDRSIDVLVTRLRRKIEDDPKNPQRVKTVRGTGYVFAVPVEAAG